MNDLTPTLMRAISGTYLWSTETAWRVLSSMASSIPGTTVDWEQNDEEWGRVIKGQEVLAVVHAIWPIVIVLPVLENYARQQASHSPFVVVVASSFSDKVFCVEKAVLERMCSRAVSENVDYAQLSINDLWWATI